MFVNKQFSKSVRGFFGSASHATTAKINAARNNMPLKGPGTRLANLSIHSNLSIGKVV